MVRHLVRVKTVTSRRLVTSMQLDRTSENTKAFVMNFCRGGGRENREEGNRVPRGRKYGRSVSTVGKKFTSVSVS